MVTPSVRDMPMSVRPGIRRLLTLSGVAALVWTFCAWHIANQDHERQIAAALHDEELEVEQLGKGIVSGIHQILSMRHGVAAALAEEEQVRSVLKDADAAVAKSPRTTAAVAGLNRFLAHAEKHLLVGALWVGDAAGKGIAAANAGTPASPIGVDYSDRLYYLQPKAGQRGHQFAVGRTTRVPGFFCSAPVLDGNRFIGFVVVKSNLDTLADWVNQADAFLADDHGVVILARNKNLEMRALPNATIHQLDSTTKERIYRRTEFGDLSVAPWGDSRYPNLQRFNNEAVPMVLRSYRLPEHDLTLTVTQAFPQLAALDHQRNVFFAFLASLGVLLIAGATGSAVYLRNMACSQEQLERIAHYDVLTGIPNRALLADRMRQAIAQTNRAEGLLAVCYLDLDGFKSVNDSLGHSAGDRLLIEAAARLNSCLRGGDTVARLGGDEFVVLLLGLSQTEECEAALQRILDTMNQAAEVAAGRSVTISASVGVTLYPADNADADTLLRHADHAMYKAKQKGKNRYEFFAGDDDGDTAAARP